MTNATSTFMKKKHRRMIKRTAKSVRKSLGRAVGPVGIAAGAVTLGGLTAVAALSPGVRQHSRDLASSTLERLRRLMGREDQRTRGTPRLEHAH